MPHWRRLTSGTLATMTAGGLRRVGWVLSWLGPLVFLAWALRLAWLEGYLYVLPHDFQYGDFPRTANLGSPEWWTGQGLFYGPIFVLEYRFLLAPRVITDADFARADFVLFGIAFVCTWLAVVGWRRPRWAILALAAWIAHHASIEAFAYTAHLEMLELLGMAAAMLLAVRGRMLAAGGAIGLAIAAKTLPAVYLPYLVVTRRWRMLAAALVLSGVFLVGVSWLQGISPWDGAYALVYQGGNLTKLEFSEYEYSPRADVARILAGGTGSLTEEQVRLAIGLHFALALVTLGATAVVAMRSAVGPRTYGLLFGMIAAVLLVVSPSAHPHYYIFLLPAWTALLADLLRRGWSRRSLGLWGALVAGYVFTGFDQPFFLLQRLFGFGLVVPEHWLSWHLPTLALLITVTALAVALATTPATLGLGLGWLQRRQLTQVAGVAVAQQGAALRAGVPEDLAQAGVGDDPLSPLGG